MARVDGREEGRGPEVRGKDHFGTALVLREKGFFKEDVVCYL